MGVKLIEDAVSGIGLFCSRPLGGSLWVRAGFDVFLQFIARFLPVSPAGLNELLVSISVFWWKVSADTAVNCIMTS
jgi:hypothetical protein